MKKTIRIAPPNSLLLVMDRSVGAVPESMGSALVVATSSCLAVGTLSEQDGETTVSLSDDVSGAVPVDPPAFDGILDTPRKRISVCTILDEAVIDFELTGLRTRVRVWTDDPSEPGEITIVVTSVAVSS